MAQHNSVLTNIDKGCAVASNNSFELWHKMSLLSQFTSSTANSAPFILQRVEVRPGGGQTRVYYFNELVHEGVYGHQPLVNTEERLGSMYTDLNIDMVRKAVALPPENSWARAAAISPKGKTPDDEAREKLILFMDDVQSDAVMNHIMGNTSKFYSTTSLGGNSWRLINPIRVGFNLPSPPSHHINKDESKVDSDKNAVFDLAMLLEMRYQAEAVGIRPIDSRDSVYEGADYIVILSPPQMRQLMSDPKLKDYHLASMIRDGKKSLFIKGGSTILINGCLVTEDPRAGYGIKTDGTLYTNVRRAALLGANAVAIAVPSNIPHLDWGKSNGNNKASILFLKERHDYAHFLGLGAVTYLGVKKIGASSDLGVLIASTYSPSPKLQNASLSLLSNATDYNALTSYIQQEVGESDADYRQRVASTKDFLSEVDNNHKKKGS